MTASGVSTAAGALLYIGTTATNGVTDSYINVGEVTEIPEFGRVYNAVKYNPLASRGTQKFKGSYDDGSVAVSMGKDLTDAGQAAMVVARDSDFDYNFKVVDNDDTPPIVAVTVGISVATPGLVTLAAHGLPAGTAVTFAAGAGALPTGISAATTYYVCAGATLLTNTFSVASSLANALAGTGLATTGSAGVGNTMTSIPVGTTIMFKAKVMSYTTARGGPDNVIMAKASLEIKSGSIVETAHTP